MGIFFNTCKKYNKWFSFTIPIVIILCFVFPRLFYPAVKNPELFEKSAPFFLMPFTFYIDLFGFKYFAVQAVIFIILASSSLILSIIHIIRCFLDKKTTSLFALLTALAAILTYSISGFERDYSWIPTYSHNITTLLVFICAVLAFHLLRVTYKPLQACYNKLRNSMDNYITRHKERRPPSKDERIAELERRVAELEKAKHDKPQE